MARHVKLLAMIAFAATAAPSATPNAERRTSNVERRTSNEERRTFYPDGRRFELRHFKDGHEDGLQQVWSPDGELYINYEVRNGRRYGMLNATPCVEAKPESAVPYYDGADFSPRWTPSAHRIAAFSLTTQTGSTISDRTLAGRPYVASFVYTKCAAVCPVLVAQLSRVDRAIANGAVDARIVSFSVTPDTDTPAALAAFGRERGIVASRWSLVTGDRSAIYGLARDSFFADDRRVGPAAGDDENRFLHTEKLLLVDGDGHLRGVYNGTQPREIDHLIEDLGTLQEETRR